MDTQKILLGRKEIQIASLESLNNEELKRGNRNYLTEHQYLSLLYNNLGYEKCPNTSDFITKGISLEYADMNSVLDYPITKAKLMINKNGTTLFDLLTCISMWGRGPIEKGYIIDENKSFILPSELEIKYHLENGIIIKRSFFKYPESQFWRSTDIFVKRLHNLIPSINKDYFDLCIRKFKDYSKQIIIYDPCVIFALALINPDALMTTIRDCEMEAAKEINKSYNGYSALRTDYDTVLLFVELLQKEIQKYASIYYKNGPEGLVNKVVPVIPANRVVANMKIDNDLSQEKIFDNMKPQDIFKYVQNIELNEDEKEFMYKYFNKNSMPKFLTEVIKLKDENGEYQDTYDHRYIPTLKRIYYTLNRINDKFPQMLEAKSKFILSESFYIDANKFALYNPDLYQYVLCFDDMSNEICEPKEAVNKYKELYNITILLDENELGSNNLESKESQKFEIINKDTVGPKMELDNTKQTFDTIGLNYPSSNVNIVTTIDQDISPIVDDIEYSINTKNLIED